VTRPVRPDLEASCVLPARAQLGECPLWSPADGRLYWVDIDGRAVHRFDPVSGRDERLDSPGRPASIALTGTPGRILVAIEHRLAFVDWSTGVWADWRTLEADDSPNRLNDGRCDPAGRFWVGSMFDPAEAKRATGVLHRIEPDGAQVAVRTGIGVSNGLAFAPDGRTMYFADTHRDLVWAYDYDVDTGSATRERVFLDFASLPGRPDGACVDADGGYWIACVFGSMVLRATPDGAIDRRVHLPVQKPTMPAFGGPAMSTLFVTTIGGGGTHRVDPTQPDAGGLFAIDVGVRGRVEPAFNDGPPALPVSA
jgi:sugar lactone lactonase YvrE